MKLKNALVALVAIVVLAVAALIVGATQARNDDRHGGFMMPGQNEQQVVPIGTIVLPDGSIGIQEGVGEFTEATPPANR